MKKRSPATQSLHADRNLEQNNMIAPPIFQSVTHYAESAEEFREIASEHMEDSFYSRYGNPTSSRIAKVIAELEGAEAGLMCSSGMGAISTAILSFLRQGDHVIGQKNHYIGTHNLLESYLPRFGVSTTLVRQSSPEAFEAAIRPETKLIILETPVNPTMEMTDLEAIAKIARKQGILTLCDNTFATPILQNPISWGVDIVLHSVTKYIGGHHDLLAGCVVGSKAHIEQIWANSLILGANAAPFNSWLALRGVRTLEMRVLKQASSALQIAKFLESRPEVTQVYYPALDSHPQQQLTKKQMNSKGGGLLSFELAQGFEAGVSFLKNLRLIQNAASLGGIDSIAIHPAVMWQGRMSEEKTAEQEISPGMIRLAVGIEEVEDLVQDISQSLDNL